MVGFGNSGGEIAHGSISSWRPSPGGVPPGVIIVDADGARAIKLAR